MQMRLDVGVTVDASLETTFQQWLLFEDYPRFMDGVEDVRRLEDGRLLWQLDRAGELTERTSRITRQVPNQLLVWESEAGIVDAVSLTFSPLMDRQTGIQMQITFDPQDFEGYKGHKGGSLGFLMQRAHADLARFKDIVEALCPSRRKVPHGELVA
ncbi:MAG TPA: SRPBCC family protein [Dehalococcoidia bacterium]|nr:SRPBCC family protein [Dehalococcoidia bacterium]